MKRRWLFSLVIIILFLFFGGVGLTVGAINGDNQLDIQCRPIPTLNMILLSLIAGGGGGIIRLYLPFQNTGYG